jgi:hypothetical protein
MTAEELALMGYQPSMGSPAMTQAAANVSPEDLQQFYAMASGTNSPEPSLTPDRVDPALLAQLMGTPASQAQMDRVTANQLAMMGVPPASDPDGLVTGPDIQALSPSGVPAQLGNPGANGAEFSPSADQGVSGNAATNPYRPDGLADQGAQSAPAPAAAANQNIAQALGFPQLADWARAAGLPRQVMPDERKVILEKYLDQQKDFLARQDPEKLLKLQKDRVELQKSTMEQSDAVAKKADAIPELQNNVQLLDDLLAAKGLSSAVGAKDAAFLFGLKKDPLAGTEAADFMSRLEQVQGKNFLAAFNQLKGAGQITEIEGAKATAALGRLGTNQSEGEFRKSVAELRGVLQTGLDRSKARLGTQATSATAPAAAPSVPASSPVIKTIPGRGTFQSLGNGQWKQIQ